MSTRYFINNNKLYILNGATKMLVEANEIRPEETDEEVIEEPTKRHYSKKAKVRKCKRCGESGHRSDNCKFNTSDKDKKDEPENDSDDESFSVIGDETDEELLADRIKARYTDQGMASTEIIHELGITLGQFVNIISKYGIKPKRK